jgi:hypothetical protein
MGMADGLLIGQVTVGPSTVSGKAAISEVINVELASNVDFVVKLPPESAQFAGVFTFTGENSTEVKLRTNLNPTDTGLPIPAQGWFSIPVYGGVTELKFKASAVPPVFQLTVI